MYFGKDAGICMYVCMCVHTYIHAIPSIVAVFFYNYIVFIHVHHAISIVIVLLLHVYILYLLELALALTGKHDVVNK